MCCLEGIIGAALRRGAVEIAAPGIGGESVAVPLLDGVGRIRQHDIEAHEAVALHELRLGEGVAALDAEVLDAVEEAVHPGDGRGHEVNDGAIRVDLPHFVRPSGSLRLAISAALRFGGGVAGVVSEFLDHILMSARALTLMEPIGLAHWSLGAAYFF